MMSFGFGGMEGSVEEISDIGECENGEQAVCN